MIFAVLVASLLAPALAAQVPLGPGQRWEEDSRAIFDTEDPSAWNIDRLPNPDDTDHLVFETVHSLLQLWPNARMRNGHNIVPAVIPQGTLLYHGTNVSVVPPGPEWVATDPEFSYLFCQSNFQIYFSEQPESCWHHTLMTTRPLKVVYFDGSSAAKMPYGSLDTQDLLVWGETPSEAVWDEHRRVADLCKWGRNFGVDGFVRMQGAFEAVLCDLSSGLSIVSQVNVACFNKTLPFSPPFTIFEITNAGSWHSRFPGETRFQLDLSGLVSFYDTQLVPSLVPTRVAQERWDHRARDISSEDLSALKSRLAEILARPPGLSSGIDWKILIQVIVDRFAGRLELTRHLLNLPAASPDELVDLAGKVQTQLRIMLTPYLVLSAMPSDPSDKTALDWTTPIYKKCATPHTSFVTSTLNAMTDSEKLLLRAVRGTSREICRVVTKMWAAGVFAGVDLSLNTKESPDVTEVAHVRSSWVEDLNRLMTWLDWSVWVKCDPKCGPEEACYLPTWPFGFPYSPIPLPDNGRLTDPGRWRERLTGLEMRTMAMQSLAKEMSNIKRRSEDWVRPQPRCIKRVEPYTF